MERTEIQLIHHIGQLQAFMSEVKWALPGLYTHGPSSPQDIVICQKCVGLTMAQMALASFRAEREKRNESGG